ncbi:MAG: 3'-5' exonuclease [Betaproteobacteria bacterium]|nr:3'-5' exonuclease [Betaproteobacteria bacterium]MDE2621756.1 3'-5' exonuclease [Betaproteobacteria bacterium]
MWQQLRNAWYRKRLKRLEYDHLFAPPPDEEWVSVDCETTGLDPLHDEIVSIGAIPIQGDRILTSQRLELIVRPSVAPNVDSVRIHRLRQMDLEGGLPPEEAVRRFLDFVGNRALVGYYLEFDVAMLNRLVRPFLGVPLPLRQIEVSGLYYDYKFAQQVDGNVDLSFDLIRRDLGLPERETHDAFNDALLAAMMFIKLRKLRTGR